MYFAVDEVVERKASLRYLMEIRASHADDALAATRVLAQPVVSQFENFAA